MVHGKKLRVEDHIQNTRLHFVTGNGQWVIKTVRGIEIVGVGTRAYLSYHLLLQHKVAFFQRDQ